MTDADIIHYKLFLFPPGDCLPSNLFHHHNPVTSEQPNQISHLAHTRDFSGQTKAQFCSQTATTAVKLAECIHYSWQLGI